MLKQRYAQASPTITEYRKVNTTETNKNITDSVTDSKLNDREKLPMTIANLNSHFDNQFAKTEFIKTMQRGGGDGGRGRIGKPIRHTEFVNSMQKSNGSLDDNQQSQDKNNKHFSP